MTSNEIKSGYTRVSTILSPFSGIDKIDPVVLHNAANRGTVVHKAIDKLIKGANSFDVQFDIEIWVKEYAVGTDHFVKEYDLIDNMITSYLIWAADKELHPSPGRMYSEAFQITGEIDCFYFNKHNEIVLVDFKTPVSESKTWRLQGSAYWYMFVHGDRDADIVEFVKLDRKGKEPKSIVYQPDFQLFESVLNTYNYFYKDYKPDVELDYI
jgi:hypothetical protein